MHAVVCAGAGPGSLSSVKEEWVLLALPDSRGLILGEVWALGGWVLAKEPTVWGPFLPRVGLGINTLGWFGAVSGTSGVWGLLVVYVHLRTNDHWACLGLWWLRSDRGLGVLGPFLTCAGLGLNKPGSFGAVCGPWVAAVRQRATRTHGSRPKLVITVATPQQ